MSEETYRYRYRTTKAMRASPSDESCLSDRDNRLLFDSLFSKLEESKNLLFMFKEHSSLHDMHKSMHEALVERITHMLENLE